MILNIDFPNKGPIVSCGKANKDLSNQVAVLLSSPKSFGVVGVLWLLLSAQILLSCCCFLTPQPLPYRALPLSIYISHVLFITSTVADISVSVKLASLFLSP